MSSKRCRIRFRSGDLISTVDEVTRDGEASVANKTKPGNQGPWRNCFRASHGNTPQKGANHIAFARRTALRLSREAGFFSAFCLLGPWVFSTGMDCKFFIAQALENLLHFVERIARRWPRRLEHPCTFGATAALKVRLFNPYQLAEHSRYSLSVVSSPIR
jgi:hypothetical protein